MERVTQDSREIKRKILWFALSSRIFVVLLSFISDRLVVDHKATGVFLNHDYGGRQAHIYTMDKVVHFILGGLVRWDGHYFLHIASYGYTKENTLAFFPLFPFAVRLSASTLDLLFASLSGFRFISYSSLALLSAVSINTVMFVMSAVTLYELSARVLADPRAAYYSAICFCVNPAGIFFTAPYSESLYSFLVFSAIKQTFTDNFIAASLIIGLSCATRSNGVLNIGFIMYRFAMFLRRRLCNDDEALSVYLLVSVGAALLTILAIVSLAPFGLFQMYGYVKFCSPRLSVGVMEMPEWCNSSIPLVYSHVQKHYWNVGFLRYYRIKQIPNFLLALPIILLVLKNSYSAIVANIPLLCKLWGILFSTDNSKYRILSANIHRFDFLVCVVHASSLTVFCVLCAHVQITTRMICSSSPVPYWFVAILFHSEYYANKWSRAYDQVTETSRKVSTLCGTNVDLPQYINSKFKVFFLGPIDAASNGCRLNLIRLYFITYTIIGTIMFSNFYPWT